MNEPTLLDIFSGIGGFSLAFESVGFRTVGFSEIDPYASNILAKHWPTIPNFGDVKNITANLVGAVDVVAGGFPCQPFSVAGKKRGDRDERFLWPECVRILWEIRPTFALFENVPGLLAVDGGRTFNRCLSDVSALGYDCLWNLVPACAVGANHERDRIWLLAHSRHEPTRCRAKPVSQELNRTGCNGEIIPNPSGERQSGSGQHVNAIHSKKKANWENAKSLNDCASDFWQIEPNMGRVANGVPNSSHRLKCLGNSIVPQVARIFADGIYRLLRP